YLLKQPVIDGRLAKWIFKIQQFDLELETCKTIKGNELAKHLAENVDSNINVVILTVDDALHVVPHFQTMT
ncbi:hypothetical protein KI387_040175, partial [Taxus chinensis]